MVKANLSTSVSNLNKTSEYTTRSGRISKRRESVTIIENKQDKKITNKQKGNQLEVRTYNVLRRMGHVVVRTQDGHFDSDINKYVGTGDTGIDMIVTTGKVILYVQCKNWEASIGVDTIRSFLGALNKYYIKEDDLIVGIIVGNTFTEIAMNESKIIKRLSIVFTTL